MAFFLNHVTVLGPPARAYAALQRLQSLAETPCDLKSGMSKCGVFSPAATDGERDFIPAGIEGSPHYVKGASTLGGCEAWSSSARPSATTSG